MFINLLGYLLPKKSLYRPKARYAFCSALVNFASRKTIEVTFLEYGLMPSSEARHRRISDEIGNEKRPPVYDRSTL